MKKQFRYLSRLILTGLLSVALLLGPLANVFAVDISVTPGSVVVGTGATTMDVTAGETITAGQVCYLDATDSNKAKLAITTNAATAYARGIALHGASSGQPLRLLVSGNFNPGGTAVVGKVYIVSDAAGGIAPVTDTGTGEYVTVIGIGTTASNIKVNFIVSGVAVP